MGEGRHDTPLTCLAQSLQRRGVASHVRDWPKRDPVLSVLVNLVVAHSDGFYQWHEGKSLRQHPDQDPEGAADQIMALCCRLRGPSFTSDFITVGDEG